MIGFLRTVTHPLERAIILIFCNRQAYVKKGREFSFDSQISMDAKILCCFLLAVGQRAYVMVRCPSCVRASVRVLTFSLNIFFSETTYRILMKFHRNVPTIVLFRIF